MGLAAPQARLLFLTSRQSDVESELMSITNQKLALSRESADISRNYSNALNAMTLAWETDKGNVDLSYNLIMRPNVAGAGQYIITNASNGNVILDRGYTHQLSNPIGGLQIVLPDSGAPGDLARLMTKQQFLMKMLGCPSEVATNYVYSSNDYDNEEVPPFTINYNDSTIFTAPGLNYSDWNGPIQIFTDPNPAACFEAYVLGPLANNLGSSLKTSLGDMLGANVNILDEALDFAYLATFNKFACNMTATNSDDPIKSGSPTVNDTEYGKNTNQFYYGDSYIWINDPTDTSESPRQIKKWVPDKNKVFVNGRQLMDTFLNYFDMYCAEHFGCDTNYNASGKVVGASGTSRSGVGGTGAVTGVIPTEDNTLPVNEDILGNGINDTVEAAYYINLYNAMNEYGWQTSDHAHDENFLENEMLYGNLNIKQLQNNGDWVTTSENDYDSALISESDENAIVRAEAEYNMSKELLEEKESKLDVRMKSLDTERTAITTEISSVESLIKKGMDRSFKIFQA